MKKSIILLTLIFFSLSLFSQGSIVTCGGNGTGSQYSIYSSTGQPICNQAFGILNPYIAIFVKEIPSKNFIDVNVYPNPTTDKIKIESIYDVSYKLYSIDGSIKIEKSSKDINYIDMSYMSNGIYLLYVEHDNKTKSFKIIKQ